MEGSTMELVITQLTDIHISGEKDLDILLARTTSIVGAIAEVISKPDETLLLICVTGDIANTGSEEEYAVASLFFDDIAEKIAKRYSDGLNFQFVFIPGNHDCDFSNKNVSVRNTVLLSREINLADQGTIEICTSIQYNFFNFVDEFVKKGLCMPIKKESIFTENVITNNLHVDEGKWNIKLHCINTAWCSQLHERKEMMFVMPSELRKEENDIVITLMHHGPNWFQWEGEDNWDEYHRNFSDIILVGHDHKFSYLQEKNYDSSTNYFIKGNQLYSNDNKEQSGFNICKINLEDSIEIFYTYTWKNELYERTYNSEPMCFERNRFKDSSISIKQEIKEYLEEIEIDIINKYKSPLLLSDIFVFPVVQGKYENRPERTKIFRGQEKIIEVINDKKRILLDGGKESGKTALLKRLFMIYAESDLFPIMLSGENIYSAGEFSINSQIREEYLKSYNNIKVDSIMQLESRNRVCLIDDFDEIHLSDKEQKKLLELLCVQFGIVILTTNDKNNMAGPIKNIETNQYFDSNFYRLEIATMRRVMKYKLIEKWLLLEDPAQDIKSLEFQAKVKEKTSQIQNVIKNGYFSNTPIEFLLVLSYIDNAKAISPDYSKYSYIYDSLIREKINDIADKDTMMCSAYMTLLQMLAYELYESGTGEMFDEMFLLKTIVKYNEEYTPFRDKIAQIIIKLIDKKILDERNNKYKFKYSYMYYYFAGSYIENVLSPEYKANKIGEIFSDLSNETNYNIALFMAYSMNTEHVILPKIREVEKTLLKEYEECIYEDQCKLIVNVNDSILQKLNMIYEIPENSQIPEFQEKLREQKDELDEIELENQKNIDETEQRKREYFDTIFNDFTKLLRLIQFEGDVLKNYATKIRNKPRYEIIELMGNSNLKLIGFFGNMISAELDKIIEVVERKLQTESEQNQINKMTLVKLIHEYMSVIWSQFIEINVSNLAICWDTDMIKQDIYTYKESKKSHFFDIVNIEYLFRITDKKLPIKEIEHALKGKDKLDNFSCQILKRIIAGYLMNYQYDPIDKQRVCELLDFNYKKLYIEQQMRETSGMRE